MAVNHTIEQAEQGGQLSYHFETVHIASDKDRYGIMERAEPFHSLLELTKGRNYEELYKNLEIDGEAVFAVLEGSEPRDIAIVEGRLKKVILGAGEELLVYKRNLRAVLPEFQRHRVGREITDYIVKEEGPDAFTGRTPNPYVFRADEKSPYIGTIFPIHKLYTPFAELVLLRTLDETQIAEMNRKTGLCKGVYPRGEFRLFRLDEASTRSIEIYNRMTGSEVGAKLEEGDGIRYLEWVKRGSKKST